MVANNPPIKRFLDDSRQLSDVTTRKAREQLAEASAEAARLQVVGVQPVELEPGEMKRLEVWVILPESSFEGGQLPATFELDFSDGTTQEAGFTLLGPNG